MLNNILKSALLFAMFAMVMSCRPKTDFPEAGGDYNSPAAIQGTWKLNRAVQNDEGAISKNFPEKAKYLDLTALFPTLNTVVMQVGGDSSFSVTGVDTVAQGFFLPTGTGYRWRLIDPKDGPRYMTVYKRDQGVVVENYRVDFGTNYRPSANLLSLRFKRLNAEGAAFVSYDYNFTR